MPEIEQLTTFRALKIAKKKAILDSSQFISRKILRMTENPEISTLWYVCTYLPNERNVVTKYDDWNIFLHNLNLIQKSFLNKIVI